MASPPLHERLVFDVAEGQVLDANRRYVLMRADVLMGMFAFLPEPAVREALAALARSVQTHGANSVSAYENTTGASSLQLFDVVAQGASSLGWGVWEFEPGADVCRLVVRNSPFAAARGTIHGPACAPIVGMMKAVCAHVWKRGCTAAEIECCACATGAHAPGQGLCRFEASAT